ncbi:MAG: 3'-to-5' oligoribonuclease A [Candidatus Carbobacillus altaicus]|uniref:3'-to-5' oligoribonuclease A n=1 Tax=Candidatus Carbonibacillus altaicus TaxID=2163959 RepID=A0A2R6XXI7_9BACL|nr:MAG: 3'-to-5' oligoribonuclease A [Candidatus Carbobacillus altaicus]
MGEQGSVHPERSKQSVERSFYEWLKGLERAQVLVVSHVRPDGDALGAQTAMAQILKLFHIESVLVNEDAPPRRFDYLPGYRDMRRSVDTPLPGAPYQYVIFVDAADRERIGKALSLLAPEAEIVNIDHHATNDHYGHINLVKPEASSTCEVIYDWIRSTRLPVSVELATCLYTGYITDTGGFRYQNTTPKVLRDAAELVQFGASPYEIAEHALEAISWEKIKLLQKALATLKLFASGKIAFLEVTQSMLEETGTTLDDAEGLVHYGLNIEGVEVAALFREQTDGIKVSLRSRRAVDVSKVAQQFGGGGHVRAAGLTLHMPLDEAKRTMAETLLTVLHHVPLS